MQRFTTLYAKTNKSAKDFDSINATFLLKAGFVSQLMAGVYIYLPLGLRVLNKIENIVRKEMDKIASEIYMSSLSPKSIWEQSQRLQSIDVLMKTSGANDLSFSKSSNEYILNPTHEDIVTYLTKQFYSSYKDFPLAVYQIQTKFRNEARAKSGLLRGREFRMKDMYSFHQSEDNLKKFYEVAKAIYWNIYEQLGLKSDTYLALASGGDFTKDFSHEFQVRCESGEDLLFHVPSENITYNREVAPSKAPVYDNSAEPLQEMTEVKGEGIIGVAALAEYLNIPVEKTTKTILFETDGGKVIAAAIRGEYEINEEKLIKIIGCNSLKLASEEIVKQITHANVGYAGILNLPSEVSLYFDDSTKGRKNFECGANRTDYHTINVNFGRDIPEPDKYHDFKLAREGDIFPETNELYEVFKGCEVGNIFPLQTKFSKAFDFTYRDERGEEQSVFMGSYGIGTSRLMGILVEKFHDDKGIIWPSSVAPYDVHLITLRGQYSTEALELIKVLESLGKEVLWDDREETSAGEKFADADLIGIPYRIVLTEKSINAGGIEIKERTKKEAMIIPIEKISETLN